MEGMMCGGLETRPNISGHAVKPATLWNAIPILFEQVHLASGSRLVLPPARRNGCGVGERKGG